MYNVAPVHMMTQQAAGRWGTVLDIWVMPVSVGTLDRGVLEDPARKIEDETMLTSWFRRRLVLAPEIYCESLSECPDYSRPATS